MEETKRGKQQGGGADIAIIGMACRFPDADDYNQFWANLVGELNSVREIAPDHWDIEQYYSPDINEPNKSQSKWCGQLSGFDRFDNFFFNISPREAMTMDPQQRLLLEETYHCVEDSGVPIAALREKVTSVHVGVSSNDYGQTAYSSCVKTDSYTNHGNYMSVNANRLSFFLGLSGNSVVLDAACASSLVALHDAKEELVTGKSDYAIAAAVNLCIHPGRYISYSKARMLSPDGQCKTFDKDANGFVPGEGVGVLLLQRLDEAIEQGNHIYGVIKGSSINHCGKTQSISAPQVEAQRDMILAAYQDAGITPDTVSYIEAHGTGTSLGDPIEIEALTRAFRAYTDATGYCRIGSVKTNIGHLEAAAGIAGVFKVLLMMKHSQIPASLNMKTINPIIDFDSSPFLVPTELTEWSSPAEDVPLRAGVTSLSFAGVNSHVLIEEYAGGQQSGEDAGNSRIPTLMLGGKAVGVSGNEGDADAVAGYPFVLSAKTNSDLEKLVGEWNAFVDGQSFAQGSLRDLTLTMMTGREQFPRRIGKLVRDKDELKAFVRASSAIASVTAAKKGEQTRVLHTGELSLDNLQQAEAALTDNEAFNRHVEQILAILSQVEDKSALAKGFKRKSWAKQNRSLYSFIIQYAAVETLTELGFAPQIVTGSGASGTWASLVVSGMIQLEDALAVLGGKKTVDELAYRRPQLPYYNPLDGQTIQPFRFTAEYVRDLTDGLAASAADAMAPMVEKAALLLTSQFSFKKYMEEWDNALRQVSTIRILETIEAAEKAEKAEKLDVSGKSGSVRENLLLMLVITSALRRLNRKWDLTERKTVADPRFYEMVDLIEDDVLTKQALIQLLTTEDPDPAQIANGLNGRQSKMAVEKEYAFLHKYNQELVEIANPSQWVEQLLGQEGKELAGENLLTVYVGRAGSVGRTSNDSDVHLTGSTADPNKVMFHLTADSAYPFRQALLDLWLCGVQLNWGTLFPDGSFQKVALPVYAFNSHPYRLKPELAPVSPVGATAASVSTGSLSATSAGSHNASSATTTSLPHVAPPISSTVVSVSPVIPSHTTDVYLKKTWIISTEQGNGQPTLNQQPALHGHIILLVNDETAFAADQLFKPYAAQTPMIIIHDSAGYAKLSDTAYRFDFSRPEQGQQAAREIQAGGAVIRAVIDLSDIHSQTAERIDIRYGRLALYQDLIKNNRIRGFHILHLTKGLQTFRTDAPTLAGADLAPLVRLFGAEYRKLQSRTIDIDFDLQKETFAQLETILLQELTQNSPHAEVIYRGGERWVPQMSAVKMEEAAEAGLQVSPSLSTQQLFTDLEKTVVITGGTRGLGAELAKHLQSKGIRKLALMGVQPIPPRQEWEARLRDSATDAGTLGRIGLIQELEAKGARVEYHTGSLTDQQALTAFIGHVRDTLGPIGGVVHCAGLHVNNNPSFVNKAAADMQRTFEPKTIGLQVLHEVFAQDDLDFFVLYSSVSAAIPELGAGVSDYGAANACLDYFAAYHNAQGRTCYRTIQWPGWTGVGMKWELTDTYLQLGLTPHTRDQGMRMFDRVMGLSGHTTILPVMADVAKLDPATILHVGQEAAAKGSGNAEQSGNVKQSGMQAASAWIASGDSSAISIASTPAPISSTAEETHDYVLSGLTGIFAQELSIPADQISAEEPFADLGVDSIMLAELVKRIEDWSGQTIDPTLLLEYPSIEKLTGYLVENQLVKAPVKESVKAPQVHLAAVSEVELKAAVVVNTAILIQSKLQELFSAELSIPADQISVDEPFADLGVDSIMLAELVKRIEDWSGQTIDPTLLLEYPSIERLAAHLDEHVLVGNHVVSRLIAPDDLPPQHVGSTGTPDDLPPQHVSNTGTPDDLRPQHVSPSITHTPTPHPDSSKIAVIGLACHFPGAPDKDAYWHNLSTGVNSIGEVPSLRWDIDKLYSPTYEKGKSISKWGGFIDGIEYFDPKFFSLKEEDAPNIDPLIRQFLEVSIESMHDAGYGKKDLWNKRVGVFVGSRVANFAPRIEDYTKNSIIGIGQNFIAAHLSHLYNFKGPNMVIDTACSSSLVALHQACQSIVSGESEMALAGGVDILLDEMLYLILSEGKALSPDGKCHTFDEKANGFVPGEGAGAVLLKPLDKAMADGDRIYAVIEASAINNDGHTMGITTPNPDMQVDVIETALRQGKIDPSTISYIETHGTGTMIGDPIELKALTKVFRESTDERQFCGVGSSKTNIGHLLSAAGIASFIKVCLSLHHKQLPPTLNCEKPNPRFEFGSSPFYPNTSLQDWIPRQGVRRAGISSFGFGGTNAHMIVSDAPDALALYQPKREALPPVEYNRKRYWIDAKPAQASIADGDEDEIIASLLTLTKIY
ncbi:beta-ketoacyl synthase N-terminal-like domain-containing protein [Brevibacillus dissolubilis]|uniref:beta-ketoacyl synthase N-terminal-like domain-containing protein n=1 Tax=Brevibacillus dissolubilis TaxID=1844116 RepID=UPI0011179EAA|nr:beta-ketoacyl synthase N-terminal-like domain-containing protein [Brevibacillus dissolubilis]